MNWFRLLILLIIIITTVVVDARRSRMKRIDSPWCSTYSPDNTNIEQYYLCSGGAGSESSRSPMQFWVDGERLDRKDMGYNFLEFYGDNVNPSLLLSLTDSSISPYDPNLVITDDKITKRFSVSEFYNSYDSLRLSPANDDVFKTYDNKIAKGIYDPPYIPGINKFLTEYIHAGEIIDYDISPDGSLIVTVTMDGNVNFLTSDLNFIQSVSTGTVFYGGVEFSSDGQNLLTRGDASYSTTNVVWSSSTYGNLFSFTGKKAKFVKGSSHVAALTGTLDSEPTVTVWDISNGNVLHTVTENTYIDNYLFTSYTGTDDRLIIQDGSGYINIWSLDTPTELANEFDFGTLREVSFDDNYFLVTSSYTADVFDIDGNTAYSTQQRTTGLNNPIFINFAAFMPPNTSSDNEGGGEDSSAPNVVAYYNSDDTLIVYDQNNYDDNFNFAPIVMTRTTSLNLKSVTFNNDGSLMALHNDSLSGIIFPYVRDNEISFLDESSIAYEHYYGDSEFNEEILLFMQPMERIAADWHIQYSSWYEDWFDAFTEIFYRNDIGTYDDGLGPTICNTSSYPSDFQRPECQNFDIEYSFGCDSQNDTVFYNFDGEGKEVFVCDPWYSDYLGLPQIGNASITYKDSSIVMPSWTKVFDYNHEFRIRNEELLILPDDFSLQPVTTDVNTDVISFGVIMSVDTVANLNLGNTHNWGGDGGTNPYPNEDVYFTATTDSGQYCVTTLALNNCGPTSDQWKNAGDINYVLVDDVIYVRGTSPNTYGQSTTIKLAVGNRVVDFVITAEEPDTDNDGMPDAWEIQYGLNPNNSNDANIDSDNDGLTNLEEYTAGTIPNDSDTDNDGIDDGWEVQYGLNPLNQNDSGDDPDNDELTNLHEFLAGTNPTVFDTDGDTIRDGRDYNPLNIHLATVEGSILDVGDMNNDGIDDIGFYGVQRNQNGRLSVITFDGATKNYLKTYTVNPTVWIQFGAYAMGDLTGDGISEIGFYARDKNNNFRKSLLIVNGGTGAWMKTISLAPRWDIQSIHVLDDISGDGINDIGFYAYENFSSDTPSLLVFSGANYTWVRTLSVYGSRWTMHTIENLGDINGDGTNDVGFYASDGNNNNRGALLAYNGATGNWLRTLQPNLARWEPKSVALVNDMNGDGVKDVGFYVDDMNNSNNPALVIQSGSNNGWIRTFYVDPARWTTQSIQEVRDINADGVSEVGILAIEVSDNALLTYLLFNGANRDFIKKYVINANRWNVFKMKVMDDVTGDGTADIGFYAFDMNDNDKLKLLVLNGDTGVFYKTFSVNYATWSL